MSQFSKFSQIFSQKAKILVAPLDWGLGHATRCIPLISHLISKCQAEITVAASGPQAAVIRESFPGISFLQPPANDIRYHKNRAVTIARLVFAMPGMLRTIRAEANWLEDILASQNFDAVISDNRYGLSNPSVPSYLVTHQLLVKTAFGEGVNRLVQLRLYKLIDRFTECWVPDYEMEPSLAGELSHPALMPGIPVRYLGPLSRLAAIPATENTQLLALLSGPEPQRTILEEMIIKQWREQPGESLVLVRGLPLYNGPVPELPNARVYNHLGAGELSQAVANARAILCRSGYSSVMDLLPLGKQCYMIATPGQSEQEYLSRFLAGQGRIKAIDQDSLQLSAIIESLKGNR